MLWFTMNRHKFNENITKEWHNYKTLFYSINRKVRNTYYINYMKICVINQISKIIHRKRKQTLDLSRQILQLHYIKMYIVKHSSVFVLVIKS